MIHKPGPVVLVVEDNSLLRLLAVELIEDAGFIAVEAANANEAMRVTNFTAKIVTVRPRSFEF